MARTPKMNDAEIAAICERERSDAQGGEFGTDSLMQNRRQAWNYYLGRPRGDEDPDRSGLQSLDVADQTEHMLAQMMQAFTTDSPAEFEPDSPQDASQVELESMAVNNILMEENDGFAVLYQAIKNALLFKTGICKVYVDETEDTNSLTLDGVTGADADLVEAAAPEEATVDRAEDAVTVTIAEQRERLVVEATEPAQFMVTANWHKQDLSDCPFVAERKFFRRHELIGMNFPRKLVAELPPYTIDSKPDSIAKELEQASGEMTGQTKGQDVIEVHECYVMLPKGLMPNSPESQRWRVFVSNRQVLEKEKVSIVPYVVSSVFLVPGRWIGLSLFDKLAPVQDAKTHGIRQLADNIAHVNSARLFVKGDVDRETLGFAAPGHHVTGGLSAEVMPLPMTDITPSVLGFLDYMDKVRSERGGASIDLDSANSQLLKGQTGAAGAAMFMGQQEMMAGFMTRTLSETLIRSLWLLIHRVAREQWRQPMQLQKAGQFVEVNPATWPPRRRVNVKTGLSPGERARKTQALQTVLQTQLTLMQAGMPAVTAQHIYKAVTNWAKCAELDNPEQYFVHPESEQAQQMSQQQAEQAQQQQQMQMQVETLPEQVKLQIAEMEDKTKRDIEALRAEVEEMKVVGAATKELELEQLRIRAGSAENSQGGNGAARGDQST